MRDAEIEALRTAVAWSKEPAAAWLRVSGDGAFAAMDRVCAAEMFVRDGQVRPTVLLDEEARVIADVYVGQEDDSYLLIAEGLSAAELIAHVERHTPSGDKIEIEELTASHDTLSVHGPYAWELIGELLGPDLIGLPYLYFYRTDGVLCVRAGKTGEYGYDLLVPRERADELRGRIEDVGRPFDLRHVGLDALEQCSLENGFFNARREGRRGLSPIELGIQWRASYKKDFVGAEALRSRKVAGVKQRLTHLVSPHALAEGAPVWLGAARIGEIVAAGFSPTASLHVAAALLDQPYFHAGIEQFTAGEERAKVSTVSPPVVNNRSLYINPQRHAYATRERDNFPPLV